MFVLLEISIFNNSTFQRPGNKGKPSLESPRLKERKSMRCLYREHRYICGNYMEIEHYPVFEKKRQGRAPKRKPTSETMKRHNDIVAKRKLIRLAHTNFSADDIRFDLTYNQQNHPETAEQAQRQMQNFLRRLRRYRKKNNLPELKYIAVTEIGKSSRRYHHHIMMNCGDMSPKSLAELWNRGYTTIKPLQFNDTGIVDLVKYFVKQPILKKRWLSSRNLKQPIEQIADGRISAKRIQKFGTSGDCNRSEFERLYKGYRLSEVRPYYNDVNGAYYVSILMRKECQRDQRRRKHHTDQHTP